MLLQDFKKKCDNETREIVTHFLSLCESSTNVMGLLQAGLR